MSITSLAESDGIHYQIQQFPWHHYNSQREERSCIISGKTQNSDQKREMREWAVVRQRSCRQVTTMARAGTLPETRIFWGGYTNFFKPRYKHKWTISRRGIKRRRRWCWRIGRRNSGVLKWEWCWSYLWWRKWWRARGQCDKCCNVSC